MFRLLGKLIAWTWPVVLLIWIGLLVLCFLAAPPWEQVARTDTSEFLPEDSLSRQGMELLDDAFPGQRVKSSVVVVVHRDNEQLTKQDKEFISKVLSPALSQVGRNRKDFSRVRDRDDVRIGSLLDSFDRRASLVLVELKIGFLNHANWPTVAAIEQAIQELRKEQSVPPGLKIDLTGSATLGRDITRAQTESADATKHWTIILVVAMLLLIYRSPLLMLIPLATVFLSVTLSIKVLSLLGEAGHIRLFEGAQIYVTILGYGAGVDYCILLMGRVREELHDGESPRAAVAKSIGKVGAALSASAATVICGIGMMVFSEFGKFREAGLIIPLALLMVLVASLTFAPSLLCLAGRWAFWPQLSTTRGNGWFSRFLHGSPFQTIWHRVGLVLTRRPFVIGCSTVIVMAPFAVVALMWHDRVNYGNISNLPANAPSIAGTAALKKHFPAGTLGTTTVLIRNNNIDFSNPGADIYIEQLTDSLTKHRDELNIADVRSISEPLGTSIFRAKKLAISPTPQVQEFFRQAALNHYVSPEKKFDSHVARVEFVGTQDPFSNEGIRHFGKLRQAIEDAVPSTIKADTHLYFAGATVSLHDIQVITARDNRRIGLLVPLSILVILAILLRALALSVYLVLSVLFSYLVTLGVTVCVFWLIGPRPFEGLDWKVPLFLFAILVAVGEDYNIFLMTRIREEQQSVGRVRGITEGLIKTGSVISACGLIMGGTFASLLAGSLAELKQMGFALAFGVLLDTLVVRPILVPAALMMFESRRKRREALGGKEIKFSVGSESD